MKLLKAMATVAGLTGVSRILGFVRDIFTAAILGAGPVADAFFVALKLPNFFRRVTAEGAFSISFVPLYSESLEKEGKEKADIFASNALSMMLLILVPFTLLILLLMPFVIYGLAPGFIGDAGRYDMAVEMSRVTFPYLLLMSLTALMGGVLNALDRFAPFAAAPIFFNICLILALLFLTPVTDTPGHAMAFGVLAAGIVQCLWLIFSIKRAGVRLRIKRPENTPKIKKLFKLMGPGVLGAGVMHVNLFVDLIIASSLAAGSISYLYYADRLNQLPLGMVGIAVGTALLPMLSKAISAKNKEQAQHLFNRALEICLLLALPAAVALFVIPETLVSTLFERGEFDSADTKTTSLVLMAYAIGMPAYIAVKVFSTAYWSQQDTLSPVKISLITTACNIALSIILSQFIGVIGIALATGIVGWLQLILLWRGLKKASFLAFDQRLKGVIVKIILSALVMGAGVYALDQYAVNNMNGILPLLIIVIGGLILYGLAIGASGAIKLSDVKKYLKRG